MAAPGGRNAVSSCTAAARQINLGTFAAAVYSRMTLRVDLLDYQHIGDCSDIGNGFNAEKRF